MCGLYPSGPRNKGWQGLSVPMLDLGLAPGLEKYRGPSVSRRGILGPGPMHSYKGNHFSMHPTYPVDYNFKVIIVHFIQTQMNLSI